jgi:hypothetical protein
VIHEDGIKGDFLDETADKQGKEALLRKSFYFGAVLKA